MGHIKERWNFCSRPVYLGFSSSSNISDIDINDIKFDAGLGLAYIATKLGVSKFKIPFASEIDKVDQIDIFPSPFRIPSKYPLTINGVPEQSSIQIMTLWIALKDYFSNFTE